MRRLLNTMTSNFCLVAILLWAQTAVAQHTLEHDLANFGHDASAVCEVYASVDNAKALACITPVFLNVRSDSEVLPIGDEYLFSLYSKTHSARAPPSPTF